MKFMVGCDLSTFKKYYATCGRGDLDDIEEKILLDDLSHCILWMRGQEILGHTLWHECSTSEHRRGDPRRPYRPSLVSRDGHYHSGEENRRHQPMRLVPSRRSNADPRTLFMVENYLPRVSG